MDVFQEYKPIRNKIALLSVEEALSVIWAYCQYLQIDHFQFPKEIEVAPSYRQLEVPQRWISEWELELLAKEVILNGGAVAVKGRTLRTWKTLSELVNSLKDIENRIYRQYGSPQRVLVELIRIAHRQFIWQANPPNSASIIRYFKIFNRPAIDKIANESDSLSGKRTCAAFHAWDFFQTDPQLRSRSNPRLNLYPQSCSRSFLRSRPNRSRS